MLYARLGGPAAMEPEDFWLVGRVISRLGSRETARECWTEGLRVNPNHPELLREIVLDLIETGKPIQAARFACRLVDVPGWQVRGEQLLGKALAADDDPRGAAETWSRALANDSAMTDDVIGLRKATARAWLQIGQPSKARDLLKLNAISPDEPETAWLLSRAYLQERSAAQAERYLAASRQYRELHPLEPEPAPHVGSARCRDCHAAITDSLWASRHSRTFGRSPEISIGPLPEHPIADPGMPSVHHSIRNTGGELRFETRKGDDVAAAVLAYAFGSGERGITLVGRDDRGVPAKCAFRSTKTSQSGTSPPGNPLPPRETPTLSAMSSPTTSCGPASSAIRPSRARLAIDSGPSRPIVQSAASVVTDRSPTMSLRSRRGFRTQRSPSRVRVRGQRSWRFAAVATSRWDRRSPRPTSSHPDFPRRASPGADALSPAKPRSTASLAMTLTAMPKHPRLSMNRSAWSVTPNGHGPNHRTMHLPHLNPTPSHAPRALFAVA